MQHPSTRDLIEQCASALEPMAWGRFVERYGSAIEAGARRALRRVGEAGAGADELQDLVQECYCRLLERGRRRLAGLHATADPEVRTWLVRFAERSARDRLRWLRASKRGGSGREPLLDSGRGRRFIDAAGSPERLAIGRQRLRQFARHCRRLSASERDARILRLVYFGGLTSREVAELSRGALSPSSVDSVVYRFRRRLAQKGLPVPLRSSPRPPGYRRDARRERMPRRRKLQSSA